MDTNAIIRAQLDRDLRPEARAAIKAAQDEGEILVSVVSAWEIGLLARNRQSPTGRLFQPDAATWFDNVLRAPGVRMAPMNHQIAFAAWNLPDPIHGDPADRLMIAIARELDVPLITRDRAILDYAAAGHVRAIAC
ncbi:MAG: type II toxin-antitoxin system VapC family toxin [Brevundimonas sp.]